MYSAELVVCQELKPMPSEHGKKRRSSPHKPAVTLERSRTAGEEAVVIEEDLEFHQCREGIPVQVRVPAASKGWLRQVNDTKLRRRGLLR